MPCKKNSASWDLQLGLNSAFKGLRKLKNVDVRIDCDSPFSFVKAVTYFKIPYQIPSLKTKYNRTLPQNSRFPTGNQTRYLGND